MQASQRTVQAADAPVQGQISGSSKATGPHAARVEANPSQMSAWQKQSSVRQVHNGNSAVQQEFDFGTPQAQFARQRTDSQGSQNSGYATPNGQQTYQTKPGTLGVAS